MEDGGAARHEFQPQTRPTKKNMLFTAYQDTHKKTNNSNYKFETVLETLNFNIILRKSYPFILF